MVARDVPVRTRTQVHRGFARWRSTETRMKPCGDSVCVTTRRRRSWYERLLGSEPAFAAHETECVWELGDSDGNEIGFGGAPLVGSAD